MAGIYIHIPFCKNKCTYCDFHFSTNYKSYEASLIQALLEEMKQRAPEISESVKTIYFGGGTPSILKVEDIKKLLDFIHTCFTVEADAEITLESNPDNISRENVRAWKKIGINRLSIGVQSFDQQDLLWMNRAHNAEESKAAIRIAQENGITNLSIDLMYGLPDMDEKRWENQLNLAIQFKVSHVSAYCLTVEEKTKLKKMVLSKQIRVANNEMQAKHFEILQNKLKAAGFIQYEISNFGKENYFSQHNSSYWKGEHYLGIGPSAHSFDGKSRSWNIANNLLYLKGIEEKKRNFVTENLSPKDNFNECILTGLRTIWGVDLKKLNQISVLPESFYVKVKTLETESKAYVKNDFLILTEKGMLFADAIALDLFLE